MDDNARLHPAGAWLPPSAEATSSGLLGALPEGWVMLGRCRTGTAGPVGYPTGCWALAHPTTGVALVDVAPDATPNAEARLRRALGAANFWPAFPGYLPVWHGRIELAAWRSLPGIMAEGFAESPPLTVPGKGAWIAAARSALADDPAWDVPGATPRGPQPMPLAGLAEEDEDMEPQPMRRPWRSRMGLVLGFAATFVVGLASGLLLLPGEAPTPAAPPPISLAALPIAPSPMVSPMPTPAPTPIPPPVPTLGQREAAPPAAAPPAPAVTQAPEPVAAPPSLTASAIRPAPEPVADAPAPPPVAATPAAASGADAGEPMEVASVGLPLPPVAPKAPVHKVARAPDRIDRACTQAVFRFQQGLPLTAAEQAHVRNGCATRR